MHRAVRGAADQRSALPDGSHGPTAGKRGPPFARADRRGNGVPHSYGPTAGATWSRIRTGRPPGNVVPQSYGPTAGATWPAFVEPTVGRLLFVPAPRSPMNAPRRARCSRPTVGSTGWFARPTAGQRGPPFARADRRGDVVPHSYGPTAGQRGPAFVEPTVGRLLFVPAPRSPINAPRPARCSRPTVGSTGSFARTDRRAT